MTDVAVVLLIVASLLAAVGLLQPLAVRLRLPHAALLAMLGLAIGAAASFALHGPVPDEVRQAARSLAGLPVRSSTFIYIFLPVLLFQAALTIDVRRLLEDAAPVLTLAVVAVVVATVVIGWSMAGLSGQPLLACLLLGAIVATTDPAAVVAIFRELGAPTRLVRLVEGESLLNDAAAIALFTMLLSMLISGAEPDLAGLAATFAGSFAGGLLIGVLGGRGMVALLPLVRDLRTAEIALSLALPYLVFILAERFLHVSGVVAAAAAGLTVSAAGRARLSPAGWEELERIWEQIAFWAGSLIFVLASILVPKLLVRVTAFDLLLLAALVVAALAARALVLFGLLPLLQVMRLSPAVAGSHRTVIWWGGIRGAVTLALALAVTENRYLPAEVKRFVAVQATGFVLFTLFVNGPTLHWLIRLLGLDRLSALDQGLRRNVLALSLAEVRDRVRTVGAAYHLAPDAVTATAQHYDERISQAGSGDAPLTERQRLALGLVALASHEAKLVTEHHDQRSVGAAGIQVLLRDADRILDAARSRGRLGYMSAARRTLAFPLGFRLAYALHRWLRIQGPLARRLAERFELMQVRRLLAEELVRFNQERLRPLLGPRLAELIDEILASRHAATTKSLDALRLQYPAYAEALEQRFLRLSALRAETAQYELLFREGLIGQELFRSLAKDGQVAIRAAEARPRLDLGLDPRTMMRNIDLFAALDEAETAKVCRLLRSCFVVPGERIIRRGDKADRAYFISSGAVEVVFSHGRVTLGRGEFFGEMALLSGGQRFADVISLSYCQLLVLKERDFMRLLERNPAMRAKVEVVARDRAAQGGVELLTA